MNFLARNIGFIYKNDEWRRVVYGYIMNSVPREAIKSHKMQNEFEIVLKDETRITSLKLTPSTHGVRFNVIYYEKSVDRTLLQSIIIPMLVSPYWHIRWNELQDKIGMIGVCSEY